MPPKTAAAKTAKDAREPRFPEIESNNRNDEHMWCLMLTLIIMCGAAVLVAVLVSAIIFMGQNK